MTSARRAGGALELPGSIPRSAGVSMTCAMSSFMGVGALKTGRPESMRYISTPRE